MESVSVMSIKDLLSDIDCSKPSQSSRTYVRRTSLEDEHVGGAFLIEYACKNFSETDKDK